MVKKDAMFRTDVVRCGDINVNFEQKVIAGFAVVTKGVTHDARGEFDDAALDSVVEHGNSSKLGIKSRFGHPNMSSTALGTFLGRVKNFHKSGDIVRADLYLDQTAHNTPDGDLAGYVLSLAKSDPDAFGASMVIHWEEEYRKNENGENLKDDAGNDLPPLIRVKKLSSVDIVDDPAANSGLFGMPFFTESVKPSAEITAFLDRFLEQPDAVGKVISFLRRYQCNRDIVDTQNQKKEAREMVTELTVEKLKAERPDLFSSIHEAGIADGKKQGQEEGQKLERERTVSILKKSQGFKDMAGLAVEAVENGLSFEQALISFQEKQLEGIKKESVQSVGPDAEPQKGEKSHLERARNYKEEHGCSMTEALQATADKRKR